MGDAIFGKIGRFAFEEIVLQLIKSKCIPIVPARTFRPIYH